MSLQSDYDSAERALTNHASCCPVCTSQPDKVTQCDTWDSLNTVLQDAGRALDANESQRPPTGL